MRKKIWIFWCLVFVECYLAMARGIVVQEKEETAIPVQTFSPPEGNTTFIDGTTWCVALAGVSQTDLQNALDWACGLGMTDCTAIKVGGPCYEPDTLVSHASFAFNTYYQANGNSDIACNFGGTATVTKNNPSHGKCVYSTSGSVVSSAPSSLRKHNQSFIWWKLATLIMISYFGCNYGH
ncbi:PREDICTED: glucan endo-1,3-beta-glucosidase 13-like [Lupinus angustifolius]|uniref:glucan endo-1,3-beta-glucosidase 13-like n=1 Tax=Lupinus angustifolius TaxID=3871 RepID=UPI00092F7170|nr:PREDICTED: glucan endo-1,3-beta-glucosidase 13-like [Lupinus angustifolius]